MSDVEAHTMARYAIGPNSVEIPGEPSTLGPHNLTELLKFREIEFPARLICSSLASQPLAFPRTAPERWQTGPVRPDLPAPVSALAELPPMTVEPPDVPEAVVEPPAPMPEAVPVADTPGQMFLPAGIPAAAKYCLLGLVLLLPIAWIGFNRSSATQGGRASEADSGGSSTMGEGGWSNEWASDATGSALGRQMTFYRPSADLSNYRVEFDARIKSRGLGWVFRAADSANYYAAKIRLDGSGQVTLSRFAVINRVQGPSTETRLSLPDRPGTIYRVRVEVQGPKFTSYIQDQAVDVWTDQRLKAGAFGFMNDRAEQAEVLRVRVSFSNGGADRSVRSDKSTKP